MIGQATTREYGVLTVAVVCITTTLTSATTGPVLDHSVHAVESPAAIDLGITLRGLEAIDVGASHIGRKVGILTERTIKTAPARLRSDVDLRRECRSDTQSAILLRCDLTELLHHCGIERSGDTERRGPI